MTIYKFFSGEKKPKTNAEGTEVIADLLKPEVVMEMPSVNPSFSAVMRRRRLLLYFLIVLAVLTFLASAAIGIVYLVHHFQYATRQHQIHGPLLHGQRTRNSSRSPIFMSQKQLGKHGQHAPIVYGVNYFDNPTEEAENHPHGYLEERIELPFRNSYERIEVPRFDECESSVIVHDFIYNFTAIVDKDRGRCFVMKLNRTLVVPPYDVIDLVRKLWTGHYTPKVRTLREKYVVSPRPVRDLSVFGKFVANECHSYTTYKLVKYRSFIKKMMRRLHEHFYGYYAFRENVIKIEIHT